MRETFHKRIKFIRMLGLRVIEIWEQFKNIGRLKCHEDLECFSIQVIALFIDKLLYHQYHVYCSVPFFIEGFTLCVNDL